MAGQREMRRAEHVELRLRQDLARLYKTREAVTVPGEAKADLARSMQDLSRLALRSEVWRVCQLGF